MTAAALSPSVEYAGNGVTLAFAAPFRFLSGTLVVDLISAAGAVTPQSPGTHYLVSGGTTDVGGTVTMVTAPASGTRLRIRRATPRAQSTDYDTNDTFPAETHELALDRAMLIDQEQDVLIDDTASRALLVPDGETIGTLPAEASRLGKFLAFDAASDPVASAGTGADAGLRTDLAADGGAALVDFTPAGSGAASGWTMQSKARLAVDLDDYAPGTDDTLRFTSAITYLVSVGGGVLRLPRRTINISATVFVPSNVHVEGHGDATLIVFNGVNPASITDLPLIGNVRTFAFACNGSASGDNYVTYPAATGDYYISDPLPFAAATTLNPGAKTFTANASGDVSALVKGDWLQLVEGHTGWHPAKSELVQVESVAGAVVTLSTPIRNDYSNVAGGFGDFVAAYELSANPPGGVPLNAWRQTGFRKVVPVVKASIRNLRIRNVNTYGGYANGSVYFGKTVGCEATGINVEGGTAWFIDSQDLKTDLFLKRASASYPAPSVFWNGSNTIDAHIRSHDCSVMVEEGVSAMRLTGYARQEATGGGVKVFHFCRDIDLDGFDIVNSDAFGLLTDTSYNVRYRGSIRSAGVAFWHNKKALYTVHPAVIRSQWRAAKNYYDGLLVTVVDADIYSTANNSLDFYLEQPIRVRNSTVGGANGGVYSIPAAAATHVLGDLLRPYDNLRVGTRQVTARPTTMPLAKGEEAFDTTNQCVWRCTGLSSKTVASSADTTHFVPNNPTSDGGIRTGDVVELLAYHSGNAVFALHVAVVTAYNSGTGEVTIGTAIPAGYAAVTGANGEARFGRWGDGVLVHLGKGAVTQITSITTGVTLDALAGEITTVSQTVAAGAEADFVVTNNKVAASDVVVACIKDHTSGGSFAVAVADVSAGAFTLRLTNLHASAAGDNVLVISFLVLKAEA